MAAGQEGIEKGTRTGVPGGARLTRPKTDLDTPLSEEEKAKYAEVLGRPAPAAPDGGGPGTALVADDGPQTRQLIAFSLERLGLRTHEVGDGADALRALKARPYGLLALDLM